MSQEQICEALDNCGLGEMTRPTATIRQFEAYGDGALNVAHVSPDGSLDLLDGDGESLWLGKPQDEEHVLQLTSLFGHYATF